MKKLAFDKEGMLSFIVRHGEKVVAGLVGLAACGLAWGGVSAFRTMRPTNDQMPSTIINDATTTAAHIEAVKIAPDDELTSEKGLAQTVAKWLSPKVEPAPTRALLNKPLFGELARRSSPEILPVEDLRAVPGVAVVAVKPKPVGDRPAAERPLNLDTAAPPRPAKPARGGRGGQPPPAPVVPPEMAGMPPRADASQYQAKLVPYVLVTGLIPLTKQQQEYDRRFGNASFRDPALDWPNWSTYQIERTEVLPGAAEKWTPIDMKAVARRYSTEWAGLHQEQFLPLLTLGAQEERRDPAVCPIPFCSPLPQLADGAWGFNAVHPWSADYLRRDAEEKKAAELKRQQEAEAAGNVFGTPAAGGFPGGGGLPPGAVLPPNPADMAPGSEAQPPQGPANRLFRFIDLAVSPGRTYRYRVKLVCWNPNYNVPARHLADASLAKPPTLDSPPSDASPPATVPDGTRLLVQPMKKQDLKRLKSGTVSAFILGKNADASRFTLRQLLLEVGGVANVDPELNKRGDPRSIGEAIETDRILLDVRGKVDDRGETRSGKPTPPPEPLEMIFLRPDGGFELTSSADSQLDIDRYRHTLGADAPDAAGARPNQPPGADSPFGNPFAPKK